MAAPLDVPFKPTELAKAAGISVPFASQVIGGKKPLPRALAIRIFRMWGLKLGPIADATDAEIAVLERFEGEAA